MKSMMFRIVFGVLVGAGCWGGSCPAAPLALHPENPHYFLFRGQPTVLVTSAEHYGAVLNHAFDYTKYLDTLAADGLNHTRTFTGCYVEPPGAFGIQHNTLAPAEGQLISPWARSGKPGYIHGRNKFDLSRWDAAYFSRLKDFLSQADRRGIVVEINLFTPMYKQPQWDYSPMNTRNNINGIGRVGMHAVYTLDREPELLRIQEAMTRKIVTELNAFDNLFYEVMNEPYFGGVTQAWHDRITAVIVETEASLPKRHLVSWNVANKHKKVQDPHAGISVFNFHYASPPTAVTENYALNKPIGLNETGFHGHADTHYRQEAWSFMLAGGALYNHLDYSFGVGHEDGSLVPGGSTPGGGGAGYRRQVKFLKDFVESFDFVRMKPARELMRDLPAGAAWQVLLEPGKQVAAYLLHAEGRTARLELLPGAYRAEWLDPVAGRAFETTRFEHAGGDWLFTVPAGAEEAVLRLRSDGGR